jgi:hypothetical protein
MNLECAKTLLKDIFDGYTGEKNDLVQFMNELMNKDAIENKNSIQEDGWEIYDTNVGHGDDYDEYKYDDKTMDEVKAICIKLKSRAFVAKPNCKYYIRSPPSDMKNRDYNSLKKKADEKVSKGKKKYETGFKTYLLNY